MDGQWIAPLLVSTDSGAVSYYVRGNHSATENYAGTYKYNGTTYYYSSGGCWMATNLNGTISNNITIINTKSTIYSSHTAAVKALLDLYYN